MGQLQAVLSWSSERIPGARLTLIPQASHILFTDQPETAHAAVLGFLDELCRG